MTGPPKFKSDYVTLTTPLLGVICLPWLGLVTINRSTKCEVSIFTGSEGMKDERKL